MSKFTPSNFGSGLRPFASPVVPWPQNREGALATDKTKAASRAGSNLDQDEALDHALAVKDFRRERHD